MTTAEYLATIPNACSEGVEWVKTEGIRSDAEAWTKLHRPDWMLWLCGTRKIKPDENKLWLFACDCAGEALSIYEKKHPNDKRPRMAIETARKYVAGKISKKKLAAAEAAAWAAARAKQADKLKTYFTPFAQGG